MTQKTEQTPTTYELLAAEFDQVYTDNRGGVELTYCTGEQVVTRLNTVLGPHAWQFEVLQHGINQEADECWADGNLTVWFPEAPDRPVCKEQFGSQKVKRSRSSGAPMDIGFDLKGAATDSLKKCAQLIGVGLYLSHKETTAKASGGQAGAELQNGPENCDECNRELTPTTFKDGTSWSVAQLAAFGRRKHQRVLCMDHYRAANELKRRAEQAMEEVPFSDAPPAENAETSAPVEQAATAPTRADIKELRGTFRAGLREMSNKGLRFSKPVDPDTLSQDQLQRGIEEMRARVEACIRFDALVHGMGDKIPEEFDLQLDDKDAGQIQQKVAYLETQLRSRKEKSAAASGKS